MAKALAVRTLFLIVVIGLMIFFSLIVLWHWMNLQEVQANKASCFIKYENFCMRCIDDGSCPGDWATIKPEGCEEFGYTEPDLEKCKEEFLSPGE